MEYSKELWINFLQFQRIYDNHDVKGVFIEQFLSYFHHLWTLIEDQKI